MLIYRRFCQLLNKELCEVISIWEGQDHVLTEQGCADVLYEHPEERSLYTTFKLTETMYLKIFGLFLNFFYGLHDEAVNLKE